jgi:hypothetical protein
MALQEERILWIIVAWLCLQLGILDARAFSSTSSTTSIQQSSPIKMAGATKVHNNFTVLIHTGCFQGSGTRAKVLITLTSKSGKSWTHFVPPGTVFQPCQLKMIQFPLSIDYPSMDSLKDELCQLTIGHGEEL